MNLLNSFALFISGGLVACSIILSYIGLNRSVLSRRSAAVLTGVGVGIGAGLFIFYGVSNRDLLGSILVGIISAVTVGITIYVKFNSKQDKMR
jgi:hypothetical protein